MFDLAQVVKSMSAPRLPDCFQKVPKKVTIVENGQILAVAVDCDGGLHITINYCFSSLVRLVLFT